MSNKIFKKKKLLQFPRKSIYFGLDRGTPIDRYYINEFIESQKSLIQGRVFEIGDSFFTDKYGEEVIYSKVLSFDKKDNEIRSDFDLNLINMNLYNQADCFICVQTLNFVYNIKNAVNEIHNFLSPGGTALVTVANMSPISLYDLDRWGDYWRMTSLGIKTLFVETFGEANVELQIFGNYSATLMFLAGYSLEEVDLETLAIRDKDFEMIIGITAQKT